jgi:hypothetical protein
MRRKDGFTPVLLQAHIYKQKRGRARNPVEALLELRV